MSALDRLILRAKMVRALNRDHADLQCIIARLRAYQRAGLIGYARLDLEARDIAAELRHTQKVLQ